MTDALREKPNAEPLQRAASAGVVVEGKYIPPPEDRDGRSWVRTTALVQADPQTLYQLWNDLENVPQWQEQIVKCDAQPAIAPRTGRCRPATKRSNGTPKFWLPSRDGGSRGRRSTAICTKPAK